MTKSRSQSAAAWDKLPYRPLGAFVALLLVLRAAVVAASPVGTSISADLQTLRVEGMAKQVGLVELSVRLARAAAAAAATPPMIGAVSADGDALLFTPVVPFLAGEAYRVEIDIPKRERISMLATAPNADANAPVVTMQPQGAALPANALKFYLHFSEPMEQGVFLDRLRLFQQGGKEVVGPFRETELWSPDGRRLTVWFHPGRQKTGVNLNEDEGPVLRPGTNYELVISGSWRSIHGIPIGKDQHFSFQAGPADHECVDPASWMVRTPKAGSHEPLRLDLRESLDPALLTNAIEVRRVEPKPALFSFQWRRSDKQTAGGAAYATVAEDGSGIDFFCLRWEAGDYEIRINPELEDLAGNNLIKPFEVDLSKPPSRGPARPTTLRFSIIP